MKNKLIILCATQRCGSTMVVDDFRSTGVLGLPEEYFIPWVDNDIENPLLSFDNIVSKSSTSNGVSVIKVMADQLEGIERNLAGVYSDDEIENGILYPRCKELFKDAIFIRIDRLDIVAQAISRYMAKATGKNHLIDSSSDYTPGNSTNSNDNYNENVKIDVSAIDGHVRDIAKEKSIWCKVLGDWDFKYKFKICYEDCIDDRSYLYEIVKFFNNEIVEIGPRKIKKIGNDKNLEMIDKYLDFKGNSISDMDVNEMRDVGFSLVSKDDSLAARLFRLVLKFRPDSPRVKNELFKIINRNN